MPSFSVGADATLLETMMESGLAESKTQARRLIQQGGVKLNDQPLSDPNQVLQLSAPGVLRVGKRRFLRLLPPSS
jgi:tyrosyl-tRNA synthetase